MKFDEKYEQDCIVRLELITPNEQYNEHKINEKTFKKLEICNKFMFELLDEILKTESSWRWITED